MLSILISTCERGGSNSGQLEEIKCPSKYKIQMKIAMHERKNS
jgi:hypothetical protein